MFSLTDMDLDKYNIHIAIFMYDTWKNTCFTDDQTGK